MDVDKSELPPQHFVNPERSQCIGNHASAGMGITFEFSVIHVCRTKQQFKADDLLIAIKNRLTSKKKFFLW